MGKNFKLLMTFLLCLLGMAAKGQNVAKVGTTEYATIQEAVAAWGPGKTLTLLADVTTTSTVEVEVNATVSTQGWTLNLGDYTWTASGCNAIHMFADGGTAMNQNYGLKINANQSGGITANGKHVVNYTNKSTISDSKGYRPRLEINGGTYNASYVVYYATSAWSSTKNGASVFINKSADGTEPVFNGNFGLSKCAVTVNAGYFNGTQFTTYRVTSTVDPRLYGGHFKTYSAFPTANDKGLDYGNYKVFLRADASIDMTNGAPAEYEAKATKTLLLNTNQAAKYTDYVYYEEADDAFKKYSSGTAEIILSAGVTSSVNKSFSSGTLTVDVSADGAAFNGNITLTGNSAKFIVKFPVGGGTYNVSVSSGGTLHVEESVADGIVTRTYSRIGTVTDPEAKVGDTGYSTVYDAFYAVDGTTDNKTIVLQKDVTNAGIVTNGTATGGDGKTVATFDLNGKSIGIGSVAAGNNADYTLTIIDSSDDKTGTVTNSDASLFILALTGINDYSGTYTLKIQAGTWQFDPSNVVINGVTYNMVDEGYVARDNHNGTWTVGEVTYVAQIGETKYVSLAKAVAAAQPNDVITMIADDEVSLTEAGSEITINKPLTITGAVDEDGVPKFTIFGSANGGLNNSSFNDLFLSCSSGTVKVSNVKFDSFGNEVSSVMGHSPVFIGSSNQNAVIENVYISNLNCEGIHINGGTFTIKDCNIDCSKTATSVFTKGICVVNDAQGSIENTTITGVDCDNPDDTSAAIELQGSGDITITGCTIQSNTIGIATTPVQDLTAGMSQVSISDCTVESHYIAVFSNGDKGALTSISSGYYSGLLMAGDNDEGFSISGGLFDDEPLEAYCAEGYTPADNTDAATNETYPYTVVELPDVAQIGEVKYKSLQKALDAAHEMTGDVTVELLDNIEGYSIVHQKAGLNLTIDGKDKTLAGQIFIDGNGRLNDSETLTIKNFKFEGNTSNFYSGTDAFILVPSTKDTDKPWTTGAYNYAHNITISDCSFNSTSTSDEYDVVCFKSTSAAGAKNVNINNCTASGTKMHSLAQFTGTTGGSITNCTVTGSESFVNVSGGVGEFSVSGNTFTSAEGASGYGIRENGSSSAVITLTDNTFTATNAVVLGKGTNATAGTINVESGTYIGEISKTDAATGKIVISGGHFSASIGDAAYADFIAEDKCGVNGLYAEETPEAPNGIGDAVASVTVGETVTKYASLETAMADVVDGSTLTLLQSISLTDKITCQLQDGESFTLAYGSYSISPTKSIKLNPGVTVTTDKTSSVSTFYTDAEGYYVKGTKTTTYSYTVVEADIEFTATNGTVTYMGYTTTFMSNSGTYKVLKDFTATARINPGSMASNVTLDLNGHTITSTAADEAVLLARAGTAASHKIFNIVDNSAEGGGTLVVNPNAEHAILVNNVGTSKAPYTDVTIGKGVTIEGGSISMLSDNSTLIVEGIINGGDEFAVLTNGNTVKTNITIKDGAVLTSNSVAMYLPGSGTTTIEEGATITGTTGIYLKSGTLNIEGGEITGNGEKTDYQYWDNGCYSTGDALVVDNCGYPGGAPTVNVTGGTFTSTNADAIASYSYGENEPIAHFVHGGYFSSELDRALLEEGKKCVPATEKPGYYKIGDIVYVAQIGETKYESLVDAVAAVPAGGTETTITMIDNEIINVVGYAVTIPSTKNVVLDLNGYQVVGTVDQEGTSALIRNLGTLTIKDSSDTNADGTGTGKLMSGASTTWTWDGTDDYTGSYASNLIRNEKDLIVESGNLYNMSTGSASYAIDNYGAGNVTINGGTVDAAKASAIRMFYVNGGSITVTDGIIGHYTSDDDYTYMGIQVMSGANVDVTVSGGTISGMYALYNGASGGNTSLSGGTFDGYVGFAASVPNISITGGRYGEWVGTWGDQVKFISGGVFADPIEDEAYIADGYYPCANTDPETMEDYPYTVSTGGVFDLYDLANRKDDKYPYLGSSVMSNVKVTYHRSIKDTQVDKWQAWFIPMDYTIKAEDLENFEFWKIHMVAGSRDPQGGAVDETNEDNGQVWIHIFSMNEGDVLKGNRPYVIKPKAEGDFDFAEETTKLYPADSESHLKLATSYYVYDFYGTYETFKTTKPKEVLWMASGKININLSAGASLGIYRWYIKPTSNDFNDDYSNLRIGFVVDGEEDPTSIFAIEDAEGSDEISGIYSVNGTKYGTTMDDLQKGVNIIRYKNGTSKKVLVK